MSGSERGTGGGAREELEALLPWYLSGRLEADERRRVEDALAEDRELRRALEAVRAEKAAVTAANEAVEPPSERALERLLAGIDAEEEGAPAPPPTAPRRPGLWERLRDVLPPLSPSGLRLAGAAATVLIVAQAAVIAALVAIPRAPDPSYQTAAGPTAEVAAPGPRIHVGFRPEVTVGEINALLAELDARLVDGPSAEGLYTIALQRDPGPAALNELVQRLRRREGIVFAGKAG